MKVTLGSGKHKTAIARCRIREGTGIIRINSVPIDLVQNSLSRMKLRELFAIIGEDIFSGLNVDVKVVGGGYVSQTNAARTAIANAITRWAEKNRPSLKLRNKIISYDRSLIVGDSRRKETKKSNAKGARARRQKSYR
ncbi:MAG: 30S ribosomal protein S9 [Candidatus Ranarchaeia archaeon]